MSKFNLEGRKLTARNDKNKVVGTGTSDLSGELLIDHVQVGPTTVTDDEFSGVSNTVTVVKGETANCDLDYTAQAIVEIPVLVVRADGVTPLPNVVVGWRNCGREVPGKTSTTNTDGKCKVAGCLPGADTKNDVFCVVQGKTCSTSCQIENGMAQITIATEAPQDTGSLKVTCYILAADNTKFAIGR
ncbi:MAG: hypothetical protein WCP79_07050 [Bacillota bacterium]